MSTRNPGPASSRRALVQLRAAAGEIEGQPEAPTRDMALRLVQAARVALEQANTPAKAVEIRDQLSGLERVFRLRCAQLVDSNLVVAQRLRTERRLGDMLLESVRQGGDRKSNSHDASLIAASGRLPAAITYSDSSRWQRIALIDEQNFELWLRENLETDELSTAGAIRLWRELCWSQETRTPPLPDGVFRVIYADPPWEYGNDNLAGAARHHYPTLATGEIGSLPIGKRAAEDSVLFLWATNPMLQDALEVMAAWGFWYKTNFAWVKDRSTWGKLGFYNYGRHELLLVGTRGSFLPRDGSLIESVFDARKGTHSQKPEFVYGVIEAMYPGPYIELFARGRRPGWEVFGNEVS